jgi:hypothetical protein
VEGIMTQKPGDDVLAQTRHEELDRLLDALGPAEPPADLLANVMQQVKTTTPAAATSRTTMHGHRDNLTDGGTGMGKKVMWGLAAAAALALIVMKFTGFPPMGDGTEGTVGAAKRYQAPQMTPSDVAVAPDEAQAFLQSDTFDRLIKDEDTRQMLANPSFRSALASAEFRSALASPEMAKALSSPELRQALSSPELRQALSSPELRQALSSPELRQALSSAELRQALASPELRLALANQGFARALANPGLAQAMASPRMAAALASPALRAALNNPGFAKALGSPQMVQALGMSSR